MMPRIVMFTILVTVVACSSDDGEPPTSFCGDLACTGDETTASCPGDCPAQPRCGDGVCSGGETTASCPGDCPALLCTADPTTCAGETICVNGSCVAAFGRTYTIFITRGMVPVTTPAGDSWDSVGGAPDPYVIATLNGTVIGMTPAVQDTFSPMWNFQLAPRVIAAGSTFILDMNDEDVAVDDGILRCSFAPLTADQLHLGTNVCDGALGRVEVRFVTQ